MRRIVVIATGMAGVYAAARVKRRLPESEVNLLLPAPEEGGKRAGTAAGHPAMARPDPELAALRDIGVLEVKDVMPDFAAKEVTVTSDRGRLTIRYTDIIVEVAADARIPRALQKAGNVFGWPLPGFSAETRELDEALAGAAQGCSPVVVTGNGASALDAVFLAREAGAGVVWLHTGEKDSAPFEEHLLSLALNVLGRDVERLSLPETAPDRLGFALNDKDGRLEAVVLPDGRKVAASCCLWTSPLMARHPILREDGVILDGAGRIQATEGAAASLGLHLMGSGAAIPVARLARSGLQLPARPGGEAAAFFSIDPALDAVTGATPPEGAERGSLGLRVADMPGLRLCRAGVSADEARARGFSVECAIVGSRAAWEKDASLPRAVLLLVCDAASRTLLGVQTLGLGEGVAEADGLLGMGMAALAESTPLNVLARREHPGGTAGLLAAGARILLNKLGGLIKGISPDELEASRAAGAEFFLLDLRPFPDWEQGHIAGAYNIPLPQLKKRLQDEVPRFTSLVLVDRDGNDAYAAAVRLAALGASALYVLDGGMRLWPHDLAQPL